MQPKKEIIFSYICYSEDEPPQEARYIVPKEDNVKLSGMLSEEIWEELESLDALNSWQYLNDKIKTATSDSMPLKSQHTGNKNKNLCG